MKLAAILAAALVTIAANSACASHRSTPAPGIRSHAWPMAMPACSTGTATSVPLTASARFRPHRKQARGGINVYVSIASPVPEPSTWAMIILGFAGIGYLAYRRQEQRVLFAWRQAPSITEYAREPHCLLH